MTSQSESANAPGSNAKEPGAASGSLRTAAARTVPLAPPAKRPRLLGALLAVYLIWLVGLSWLAILILQGD